MRKRGIIIIGLIFLILGGCGRDKAPEYVVDSKTNYHITVPYNEKDWFSVSVYRIYNGEEDYSTKLKAKDKFTVGTDAVLTGENMDVLNGMEVVVSQMDFVEPEDYLDNLAHLYGQEYGELDEDGEVNTSIKSKLRKNIDKYSKNAKVLCIIVSYWGELTENVKIEQLSIPELNLTFDFDSFEIETIEVPDGVQVSEEGIIDYYSAQSGFFMTIGRSGSAYKPILGKALTDIKSLTVESANYDCIMVEETEYSFRENEEIQVDFSYLYNDSYIDWENSDGVVASLITKIVTEDGREVWEFHQQPSYVAPEYLLQEMIFEEIAASEVK